MTCYLNPKIHLWHVIWIPIPKIHFWHVILFPRYICDMLHLWHAIWIRRYICDMLFESSYPEINYRIIRLKIKMPILVMYYRMAIWFSQTCSCHKLPRAILAILLYAQLGITWSIHPTDKMMDSYFCLLVVKSFFIYFGIRIHQSFWPDLIIPY